jgi:hypothetical protein
MNRIKLTDQQKRKRRIIAGIFGFIVGGWMIFIAKDNFGFLIAIISAIILLWK